MLNSLVKKINLLKICIFFLFCSLYTKSQELGKESQFVSNYRLTQTTNGTAIFLNEPYKIEWIKISPNHAGIWGLSKYVKSAFVKTKNSYTIANLVEDDEDVYLFAEINDENTDTIELIPLFYAEDTSIPTWRVEIKGFPSWKYEYERYLETLSRKIINFHQNNNCFCCHRLFTYSLYTGITRVKNLNINTKNVKEVFDTINKFQDNDGSYKIENAYTNFGIISPTLIAVLSVILSDITSFYTNFDMYLYRACLFLYKELQKKYDSKMNFELDYTLPPLFESKVAGTIIFISCNKVNKLFRAKGLLDAFPNFEHMIPKFYIFEKNNLLDDEIIQYFPYLTNENSEAKHESERYTNTIDKLLIISDILDYYGNTKFWLTKYMKFYINKYKRYHINNDLSETWKKIEALLEN